MPSRTRRVLATAILVCLVCGRTLSAAQQNQSHTDTAGAFVDSLKLVSVEHAIRIAFQQKTTSAIRCTARLRDSCGRPRFEDHLVGHRPQREILGDPLASAGGWVDHVVTPVAGMGLVIAEDALDQFFLKWVEARVHNRLYRASLRMIFNPGRTLGNLSTNQAPWVRERRPLSAR